MPVNVKNIYTFNYGENLSKNTNCYDLFIKLYRFCVCCSYTGNDESIILCGDSQGCVNVLMIKSAGECLRYCVLALLKLAEYS